MDQVPASSANEILTSQSSESPVPFVPRPSVDTEIHESDPTEETRRRYEETRRRYPFRRPKNSEEFVEELIMRKLMKKKVAKEEKKDEPKKEDGKKTQEKRKREVKKEAPKTGDQEKNKPMPKIEEQKGERTKAEDYGKYETLRRAAVDEDWDFVKKFIEDNPEALTAELLDSSETILHYVVKSENMIDFGRELVAKMPEEALELTDIMDMTALSYCAAYGNTEAAKIMVQKNHKLINIPDRWGRLPLHYAARFGHKDTVDFLFSVISKHDPSPFKGESGVRLVQQLITANLYVIALELLERYQTLAREQLKDKGRVLETLAQKPLGFASGSQLGFWKHLIYNCIPDDFSPSDVRGGDVEDPKRSSKDCFTNCTGFGFLQRTSVTCGAMSKKVHVMLYNTIKRLVPSIKSIHDTKLMHKHTCELVKLMCEGVTLNFEEAKDSLKWPILTAARLGIEEIVYEIMKTYFFSTSFVDEDGHNIFQLAVLHRQEKVFSLIDKTGLGKEWALSFQDKDRNNILHLAGMLVPSSRVSGAALQMQRELQWYKVVENLVHPSLQEVENKYKLTPRKVFTREHIELVKAGQEWIKGTATSCSVVAALIITVAFAAAITVPGGNDSQGKPNYLDEKSFLIFSISNALALFFSSTSVLMFLGILTSRYSEEDFHFSLPRKMIIGLITLFLSIAAMMIAFGATLHLIVFHPLRRNISPIILLHVYQ